MGYVHDTQMSRFLHAEEMQVTAGTWTDTVASNIWSKNRGAADAVFTIKIPAKLPSNAAGMKGAYLKSVDLWWEVATAAMDAVSAAVYKNTAPANGVAWSAGVAQSFTYDSGHDTAPERLTLDEHKMTLSLTTPIWIDDDELVHVELVCDAAATSVFKYYGARLNYTLRL